jgi:proline iminopeptidase
VAVSSFRCYVPVNGLTLHVHALAQADREGEVSPAQLRQALSERPLLLVLHGGPGGDHRPLVEPLAPLADAGLNMLLLDLRGHGLSGRPDPTECTLAHMADDVQALLAMLELPARRSILLGVSFGGGVALTFGQRHPNACAGLVLSSAVANHRADDDWARWIASHGTPEQALAAATIVNGTLPNLVALQEAQRLVRPLYYADAEHLPAPSSLACCANEHVPPVDLDLVNWWYREGRVAYCADVFLGELRLPTLILGGCADPLGTPAQARALAAGIPGARLRLFERSGHLPHVEQPDAYRMAIRDFVREMAAA